MINSYGSSNSGISASFIRADVSANDIANINTPGYEESSVIQSEKANFSGTEVSDIRKIPNNSTQFSNTNLATETVEQMSNSYSLKSNIAVLKVQDEMLGEILDIKA